MRTNWICIKISPAAVRARVAYAAPCERVENFFRFKNVHAVIYAYDDGSCSWVRRTWTCTARHAIKPTCYFANGLSLIRFIPWRIQSLYGIDFVWHDCQYNKNVPRRQRADAFRENNKRHGPVRSFGRAIHVRGTVRWTTGAAACPSGHTFGRVPRKNIFARVLPTHRCEPTTRDPYMFSTYVLPPVFFYVRLSKIESCFITVLTTLVIPRHIYYPRSDAVTSVPTKNAQSTYTETFLHFPNTLTRVLRRLLAGPSKGFGSEQKLFLLFVHHLV